MPERDSTNRSRNRPIVLPTPAQRESGQPLPRIPLPDFARRTTIAVLITLLLLAIAYLMWRGINTLMVVFAGVLFAVLLSALTDWVSARTRLPRGWSLGIVVVVLLAVTGGIGFLLANRLAVEFRQLAKELPQSIEQVRNYLSQYAWGNVLLEQLPKAENALPEIARYTQIPGLVSGLTGFLVDIVVIFFVGIFGAAEPEVYKAGLLHLVPPSQRQRGSEAIDAIGYNLRWWLVGQIVLMILMWVTTTAGLWLLGVPLALVLGVIAGILELIPYIGAWLSAVPALLMSLLISPTHLLMTLGLYLLLHILEGYLFLPLIQRRAAHIAPALTLVTQVLLGEMLGLIGLFVAAPLTVVVVVLLKMLYIEDTLGDDGVDVPGEPGNQEKPAAQQEAAAQALH
jgi:predicted PurR-regulated permease PerM